MPSTARTVVEKVATTGGTALNRAKARIMNEPVWHAGGMEFWIDGAHVNSQPNDEDPIQGSQIIDLAQGRRGTWRLDGNTMLVDYATNGWNFAPAFASGDPAGTSRIDIPAAVAASIWGDGTVPQFFGVVQYLRLPSSADWNAAENILPFVNFDTQNNFATDPAMVILSQLTTGGKKTIQAIRPVTLATRDTLSLTVPAAAFGKFAQLAFWRDGTGIHLRLRYDDGTTTGGVIVVNATGLGNATNSFAAIGGRVGLYNGYTNFALSGTGWRWKLYALGIENLRNSGRDFAAVIDSDWSWRLAMARGGIYS